MAAPIRPDDRLAQLAAEERSSNARMAVLVSLANSPDLVARTAPARAALAAKHERERALDPDGQLDPAERSRRAGYLQRARIARLAYEADRSRRLAAEMFEAEQAAKNNHAQTGGGSDV